MVLAERNSDNVRNGRRSRGPSPNGHASDSSSEEEGGKYIFKIVKRTYLGSLC